MLLGQVGRIELDILSKIYFSITGFSAALQNRISRLIQMIFSHFHYQHRHIYANGSISL
jgi:hypothetical protein